mmetsp:Transcript_107515/g.312707  ORF Transcript_107515/g.312707 Transcript_107515/m.312707 type:complete len:214 (+) Transcript_107515:814-1455(+)
MPRAGTEVARHILDIHQDYAQRRELIGDVKVLERHRDEAGAHDVVEGFEEPSRATPLHTEECHYAQHQQGGRVGYKVVGENVGPVWCVFDCHGAPGQHDEPEDGEKRRELEHLAGRDRVLTIKLQDQNIVDAARVEHEEVERPRPAQKDAAAREPVHADQRNPRLNGSADPLVVRKAELEVGQRQQQRDADAEVEPKLKHAHGRVGLVVELRA